LEAALPPSRLVDHVQHAVRLDELRLLGDGLVMLGLAAWPARDELLQLVASLGGAASLGLGSMSVSPWRSSSSLSAWVNVSRPVELVAVEEVGGKLGAALAARRRLGADVVGDTGPSAALASSS
jgi:hypothetical protein